MLYGGILGDIAGSRFEAEILKQIKTNGFKNIIKEEIDYNFDLLTKESKFTDDTVLLVALTDSVINNKNWISTAKEYALKYYNAGYGKSFKEWVDSFYLAPYDSYGNGSAMRVASIGYFSKSWEECMERSCYSASITHNHKEGIKGAQAVAGAIYLSRKCNLSKNNIKLVIEDVFGYDLSRSYSEIQDNYKVGFSCQKTVPESIICFLESNSVEDAIRKSICLNGDSDTMACIAGNIAEAYYGDIDNSIVEKINEFLPEEFVSILEKFNSLEI